jgi:hypothetical protein
MDAVDRHRPLVAGDVPVKLVDGAGYAVGEEIPDRVSDLVVNDDGAIGVDRGRNVNVEAPRPPVDGGILDDEGSAIYFGNRCADDVQFSRAALGGVVVEREIPIDPVPGAVETDRQRLGYVERSVATDGEQRIEVADANGAALRARRTGERAEKEADERASKDLRTRPWEARDLPPRPGRTRVP